MKKRIHTRRGVLKTITAAALAATKEAFAAATQPTTAATTQASSIAMQDLIALERVLGREFSDSDRKLMAEGVESNRKKLKSLRERTIPPDIEPAVHFDPRLPEH